MEYLFKKMHDNLEEEAIVWRGQSYNYAWLLEKTQYWIDMLSREISPNSVVDLSADFSPTSVALLLALIQIESIIVPMTSTLKDKKAEFRDIAEVEYTIEIDHKDQVSITKYDHSASHAILCGLKEKTHPGLILFSSGSTGKSKAAVHDFYPLLKKFEKPRYSKRIMTFLLFDHIGGINTLLYTLYNAGCIIVLEERTPHTVCQLIQDHHVQILPTSPTFLNLLLVSGAYKEYSLSSLELITYGTEVMPKSTLERLHHVLPNVKLQQTYGLSELGILRSKSKSSDSLLVKIGGEGFETRIVDGLLEIKAKSAMLGYLNAPSPFTEDGWFKTGDAVIVEGEYLQILGRKSEMINVGGEKVYPAQVESVLQEMDGVCDVMVVGEKHPLMGNIVKAVLHINTAETNVEFRKRMRKFSQGKLLAYQIPQKVVFSGGALHSDRFKKLRRSVAA